MRANVVNRAMEIISLAERSNDSFSFEQNAKFSTYLNNAKTNLNSKNKYTQGSHQHKPSVNLSHLRGLDSYEPTNQELSKETIQQDFDDFVYEDYIIELIYPNHISFREIYNELSEVDFVDLPKLIKRIVNESVRIADKRKIFIDGDKMYNFLFSKHNINLAIKFLKNNVVDLDISNEKIIRIYDKIKIEENYNYDVAVKEVNKFVNFVELLSA